MLLLSALQYLAKPWLTMNPWVTMLSETQMLLPDRERVGEEEREGGRGGGGGGARECVFPIVWT